MICSSKNTHYFKNLIEDLGEILTKTHLIFTNKGLSLVATDNVQVTHINLQVYKSFFSVFELTRDKINIGVDLQKLIKIFRCSDKEDTFTMTYDREFSFLKIEFQSSKENRRGNFKLNLEEISVEQ